MPHPSDRPPLVSILIPAYRERYFRQAFESARAQEYDPLEIVVSDDSEGDAIRAVVGAAADPRVRYIKNPARLGFAGNFTSVFRAARGAYVKFLNDDDRLLPGCVPTLASMLHTPSIRLAVSRRRVIDGEGAPRADIDATIAICHVSSLVHGRELGDLALVNATNLIGEPSTGMFRRADLQIAGDDLFRWGDRSYHCLADLSLWLRLLDRGLAYYHAAPLSEFRMHDEQEQNGIGMDCLYERLWIARQARAQGYLATPEHWRAAMERIRARVRACDPALVDEATRSRLAELDAELEAELQAPSRAAALPA